MLKLKKKQKSVQHYRKRDWKTKLIIRLRGSGDKTGLAFSVVRYVLLAAIAFAFLYPVIYMVSLSLMTAEDLSDITVRWLPNGWTFQHYYNAWMVMSYSRSLWSTLKLTVIPTILQTIICAITGYGFARYKFPLKGLWMGILFLAYLLPAQATALPNYVLFQVLGMTDGTIKPFVITAVLGQGINSSLCVLIFYSFHKQVPKSLLEAAEIDGAGQFRTFWKIAMPMATAGIIVVSIFSIVWYWNDIYLNATYIGYGNVSAGKLTTLIIQLTLFENKYVAYPGYGIDSPDKLSMAKKMAGTVLATAPMILMYIFVQRKFVKSIDSAGITGE